jgi:hypothetical protein
LTERAIQPLVGHAKLRKLTLAGGNFEANDRKLITAAFPTTIVEFP